MLYKYILQPVFKYPWRIAVAAFLFFVWIFIGLVIEPCIFTAAAWQEAYGELGSIIKTGNSRIEARFTT